MEHLPKIVQQGLVGNAQPGVHPDPDLLAAFAENSLRDRERTHVLQHLAVCAHCRELVALATPENTSVPSPNLEKFNWFGWPMLRWGAVAACVVVVGTAVTLHYERRNEVETYRAEKVVPAAPAASLERDARPNAESVKKLESPSRIPAARDAGAAARKLDGRRERGANAEAALSRTEESRQIQDKLGNQPSRPPMVGAKTAEAAPASNAENDDMGYAAKATSQAAMSRSAAAAPRQNSSPRSELKARDESNKDEPSKNELHKEIQSAGAAVDTTLQDGKFDTLSSTTAQITEAHAKPSRAGAENAPRWTIAADGSLQRSFDSGHTWQTVPVASGVVFRALSANGSDIWMGGAAGVLYHSADAGQHWTRVTPAVDGTPLTSDIVAVEFRDPLHGNLKTSDRETWSTSNAGETWQRR